MVPKKDLYDEVHKLQSAFHGSDAQCLATTISNLAIAS
jgi:hypothetical protein